MKRPADSVESEYPRKGWCPPGPDAVQRSVTCAGATGRRFDVALWRSASSMWPEWIGVLEAQDAFSAVVQLMQTYGRSSIWYASARVLDGSVWYRAFQVQGVARGLVWFSDHKGARAPVGKTVRSAFL